MKKIYSLLLLSVVLVLAACGSNDESRTSSRWRKTDD